MFGQKVGQNIDKTTQKTLKVIYQIKGNFNYTVNIIIQPFRIG